MSEERGRFRIVYAAFTKFFGSTCLSAVKIGTVSGRNYAEAKAKLDKIENVVAFTKIAVDKRGRITVQERMNKFFPAGLPSPASGRTPLVDAASHQVHHVGDDVRLLIGRACGVVSTPRRW